MSPTRLSISSFSPIFLMLTLPLSSSLLTYSPWYRSSRSQNKINAESVCRRVCPSVLSRRRYLGTSPGPTAHWQISQRGEAWHVWGDWGDCYTPCQRRGAVVFSPENRAERPAFLSILSVLLHQIFIWNNNNPLWILLLVLSFLSLLLLLLLRVKFLQSL